MYGNLWKATSWIEESTWGKKSRFTDDSQAFIFGCVESGVALRHPSGDVKQTVGYYRSEMNERSGLGSSYLGVVRIW